MSQARPRVSLGLPVFNGEKYLKEAVDSIIAQTFSDFELIICDNASTDKTQEICEMYADLDPRISYFRNDRNLGAAPNFNRAFELSSGEYFKWAAHDDLIDPDYLSQCVQILDQYPEMVLCFTKAQLVNPVGDLLHEYDPEPDTSVAAPHERFRNLLFTPNLWLQVFGLIRTEIARKTSLIGSYPGSDTVFVTELSLRGSFYKIPHSLFSSRIHPEQSIRGSLTVERDRVSWFDTSLNEKILFPKWQYLVGYLNAIRDAPLSGYERIRCYLYMVRWVLIGPHFRALGKDLLLAAKRVVLRAPRSLQAIFYRNRFPKKV